MKKTLIDFSQRTFSDVFDEHTKKLVEREAKHNKWLNKDGSKKKNYYWKYASKTKQGDAGESVVCTTLILVLKKYMEMVSSALWSIKERVNLTLKFISNLKIGLLLLK